MKWIIWRATCRVREFIRMILEYPCLTLNKVIVPVILKVSMFYTHNERKKRTIHGHHAERQIRKLCALKFRNLNTVQSWMINMGNYFSSSKKKKNTQDIVFLFQSVKHQQCSILTQRFSAGWYPIDLTFPLSYLISIVHNVIAEWSSVSHTCKTGFNHG